MQPENPIVGGTTLRIPAIQSPDYVAGTSGWTVNIDGTAEFNNVTVRGVLIAQGSNGSSVQLETLAGQALITMTPSAAEYAGHTLTNPAFIEAFVQQPGATPVTTITSPQLDGLSYSQLALQGEDANSFTPSAAVLTAGVVNFASCSQFEINGQNQSLGLVAKNNHSSDSAAISAETVVATITTPTIKNGRAYEVRMVHTLSSTASTVATVRVRSNNTAGTLYGEQFHEVDSNFQSKTSVTVLRNDSGADITNVNLVMTLQSASGSTTIRATSYRLWRFELWDIGASSDWSEAIQV